MKGARGKGKHYDKMVHYKTMCTAGCQLAGTPSAYLPSSSLSSLQALASPDDDSDVQNGSEMDSSSETIQEMVRILREGCYEACSITCQESDELRGDTTVIKCARACASGCDNYLDRIEE